jgi:8-oxo-dGTP pyrophosphatase MutT (NUDIX family)
VYEFPTWVAALPVTKDGKVILIRQYRQAVGEILLEIPGGCVDDTDANFQEAVARELQEETGYTFGQYEYLGKISPNTSTNTNYLHMFLATGGEKTTDQHLDENEEIEILTVTFSELKQLIRENKILQSMHVTCILYALERLKEISF